MSDNHTDRLEELLIQQATSGLDEAALAELRGLLALSGLDPEIYERAAAAADLAIQRVEDCPPQLKVRLVEDARDFFGGEAQSATGVRQSGWIPWLAFAAALLLAVVGWWPRLQTRPPISMAQQWQQLSQSPDTLQASWQAAAGGAGAGAEGEVLWSSRLQQGLMRFRGLQANDPSVAQYQLWIFDNGRDERFPVDGGVFDIDPESRDVFVPIRAKLKVSDPVLFAVTVERPGGVVVSRREQVALLAPVS